MDSEDTSAVIGALVAIVVGIASVAAIVMALVRLDRIANALERAYPPKVVERP